MSTSPHIDLNADLGESTAGNPVADDAAMMELVTSANVACGFHAGDPHHIAKTLHEAARHNITVGAHPGYNDKAAFGRRYIAYNPKELASEVLYQIGALDALARAAGTKVSYVKPHGAMYNAIVHDHDQAKAVIEGIKAFGDLPVMLLPGAVAIDYAEAAGLTVIREAFADRGYLPDGTLVPRSQEGAVLHDAQQVADRVLQIARDGSVTAIDGTVLKVNADSICVHGDSPGAVEMTRQIVRDLDAAGVVRKAIV